MKEAVTKVIDTLTQEDFDGAFQKLLERYKCIAAGGEYFEEDYSFMCVLSIKVPIRKMSGNLLYAPRILWLKVHCTFIFTFFCLSFSEDFFCPRSYLIGMIFKQSYLIHTWHPNWYYNSEWEWTWEQWQRRSILHFPDLQNRSLTIRCSLVSYSGYSFLGGVLTLCMGQSYCILNPAHREWPSRLELQNTPTASLQRGKTPPMSVLDMILSNLMVRLQ